jgi:hypothetical protein
MKRHIIGLSQQSQNENGQLEGLFLVRVERASYRWHPQKPFFTLFFVVLEPKEFEARRFSGRLYGTAKALWKLNWFLRDFGYDQSLLAQDDVDEKAVVNLRGVVRISHMALNGHTFLNLEAFAPAGEWEEVSGEMVSRGSRKEEANHDF